MKHSTTKLLASAATMALAAGGASAGTLLATNDGIIQYSLCVGGDCATSESFGFDTIRLKENNLTIHFDDTSSSGSFPNNDWRLTANDTGNGGDNYFSIDDATAGTKPFSVAAGAGNNALTVDSDGDVGIGTANAALELHVTDGDSPSLRLQQDGSNGWTPQVWDVVGNEANFFVRDVTNGSQLPFKIKPGADTNALYIDSDNNIGMLTSSPDASLHVRRTDGSAQLKVEEANGTQGARVMLNLVNNGRPDLVMANTATGGEWAFGGGTNFVLKTGAIGSADGDKTLHLKLFGATGNMEITGTLTTGGGTCGGGCDAVFTEEYDLPSIEEHSEAMYSLGYLPNVGPTIENEPINVSDKMGRMLNELEHAHIYIDELHKENSEQKAAIAALTARLDALETKSSQ